MAWLVRLGDLEEGHAFRTALSKRRGAVIGRKLDSEHEGIEVMWEDGQTAMIHYKVLVLPLDIPGHLCHPHMVTH